MITKENYHQPNNRALSRSRIMDFKKSKPYFKGLHIDGTIIKEKKKAFDIGIATDNLLAQIENKDKFAVLQCDGRTKAGKEEREQAEQNGCIVLNQTEYETILGMAISVEETDAYRELKAKFKMQQVLCYKMDLGPHFDYLVAMPDYLLIEGNKARVWDLKTAAELEEKMYYFHAMRYWYFQQMGITKFLIEKLHPEVTEFEFGHIVVEKTKDIWNVDTFFLDYDRVEQEKNNIISKILPEIALEREFRAYNPSLSTAKTIGSIMQDF